MQKNSTHRKTKTKSKLLFLPLACQDITFQFQGKRNLERKQFLNSEEVEALQ